MSFLQHPVWGSVSRPEKARLLWSCHVRIWVTCEWAGQPLLPTVTSPCQRWPGPIWWAFRFTELACCWTVYPNPCSFSPLQNPTISWFRHVNSKDVKAKSLLWPLSTLIKKLELSRNGVLLQLLAMALGWKLWTLKTRMDFCMPETAASPGMCLVCQCVSKLWVKLLTHCGFSRKLFVYPIYSFSSAHASGPLLEDPLSSTLPQDPVASTLVWLLQIFLCTSWPAQSPQVHQPFKRWGR